jgi:nitrite reductase/ring-hydroxylating ferredoxin subunit
MKGPQDRVGRFVDDLLRNRRPRRFEASDEEAEAIRGALEVRSAKVGTDLPDPEFVRKLERKVLAEAGEGAPTIAHLTRRALLRTAGTAAAAMVVGAGIEYKLTSTQTGPISEELVPNGADWRPVAALSELPPGTARRFSSGSVEVVVVNDGGVIRALSAICTHLGCVLKPDPAQPRLDCPCHRTAFSWSGKVINHSLPSAPASLPLIRSRVREGQIEIYVV